jgi:hypothetical protein
MYRRARERIIAAEVMKLERRQAGERVRRRAQAAPGPAPHADRGPLQNRKPSS